MMNKGLFSIVMAATMMICMACAGPKKPVGPVKPIGPEFQVNTYTAGDQRLPSVAMDRSGNFIVAWSSFGQDGSGNGVYCKRYDMSGTAQGNEFQVNTYTEGQQGFPSVAMNDSGDFVVVWASKDQDGDGWGVYGQRYDVSGTAQGGEFQVNTCTKDGQATPAVAMDALGNFVVMWKSWQQDGHDGGVYGQCYDASGTAQGSEFLVNTFTIGDQRFRSVGMDRKGNFVATWMSCCAQDSSSWGVYGQRYDASGTTQGSEFQVNTYTPHEQGMPSVGMDGLGNFIITWMSEDQDGDGYGVYGQRYDASGTTQGNEFQINTFTKYSQWDPSVCMDSSGNFVVVWHSSVQDGSGLGVYGQCYDASGTAQGAEFQVNTYTIKDQTRQSVAMDDSGNFVVIWESEDQDGNGSGVYGQRYTFDVSSTTADSSTKNVEALSAQ